MRRRGFPRGTGLVVATVLSTLLVSGCAGAEGEPSSGEDQSISVTIRNGQVTAEPEHPTISLGDHVDLKVSSDVSDEVHVHGYDIMKDVTAGTPVDISFDAEIPGEFEAELEQHHQTILEFDVK